MAGRKKILVIDDEPDLLELVKKRLEASGYKVVTAQNGIEGFEKAKEEKPNLILLDIMMPVDGFKVLTQLKADRDTSYIPTIMLTYKGESALIFEAERLGATDYVIKPFDSKTLLSLIKRYV